MKISRFTQLGCVCMISAASLCHAQDHVATLMASHELEVFDEGQLLRITISASIDQDVVDLFGGVHFDTTLHGVVEGESFFYQQLVDIHDPRRVVVVPPSTLLNMRFGQLHFPPAGIHADPTNPLPICFIEFFSRDLRPRELTLEVSPIFGFSVYPDAGSAESIVLEPGQYPERLEWTFSFGIPCRADIDGDGQLTLFDFLEFQNLFAMGDLRADFDGDGELTFFDFLEFQNEFALGCE